MKRAGLFSVTIACLGSMLFLPSVYAELADSPWPMFQHDAQHTGQSQYGGPAMGKLAWSYERSHGIIASPALGLAGRIYVADWELDVFSPSGALCWSYEGVGIQDTSAAIASDGHIYMSAGDNGLYALHSTGPLAWSYITRDHVDSGPAIDTDGKIYFGTHDSNLFYVLTSLGSLAWSYDVEKLWYASPALATDGSVYVGRTGNLANNIYALTSSGKFSWSYGTAFIGYWSPSSPVIGVNSELYIAGNDNNLYNLSSVGTLRWSYGGLSGRDPALSSEGCLYIGGQDNKLYTLTSEGKFLWSYQVGWYVHGIPILDSASRVYISSADNNFYSLTSSGMLIWSYASRDNVDGRSALALGSEGQLYAGTWDSILYCFQDLLTPTVTPTVPTPTPTETPALTPTPTITPSFTSTPLVPFTPTPVPQAQVDLGGASLSEGEQLTATFVLNEPIERKFTVYAAIVLPDGSILDALTLGTKLKPLAVNVKGLAPPFSFPFINVTIPAGAPKGVYQVLMAFYDPKRSNPFKNSPFLLVRSVFTVE